MNSESDVSFNLWIMRSSLGSIVVADDEGMESEVSGSLGSLKGIRIMDGILLEIQGSLGVLRISLPHTYLKLFETCSGFEE